jgi:hypothetical protein
MTQQFSFLYKHYKDLRGWTTMSNSWVNPLKEKWFIWVHNSGSFSPGLIGPIAFGLRWGCTSWWSMWWSNPLHDQDVKERKRLRLHCPLKDTPQWPEDLLVGPISYKLHHIPIVPSRKPSPYLTHGPLRDILNPN